MSEKPKLYGIDQQPLYGCCQCNDEYSWPADDLRVYEGECWCDGCWDSNCDDNKPEWRSLQKFEPAKNTCADPANMVELTTLMYWHGTLDEWAKRFDLMTREKSKQQAGDSPVEQFAIRMHDLGKRLSNLADVFDYVEQLEKRADPAKDAMREVLIECANWIEYGYSGEFETPCKCDANAGNPCEVCYEKGLVAKVRRLVLDKTDPVIEDAKNGIYPIDYDHTL